MRKTDAIGIGVRRCIGRPAAAAALLLGLAACSSGGPTAATGNQGGGSSFAETFGSSTGAFAQAGGAAGTATFDPADCPPIDIRHGTSTLSVTTVSRDPSAVALRYQGTIGQTARECALAGQSLTIKVGVHGRIIVGPAGGPGRVDVPIRFALVQEGIEPKTIWTRFYNIPVTVGEGQNQVAFTHVEDNLTVPRPDAAALDAYVIYIGFDPLAAAQQPKPRTQPRRPQARS